MTKELCREYVESCGGVESFIKIREELMELVCSIDDVIEMEAKLDMVDDIGVEMFKKITKMVMLMAQTL